MFSLQFTSPGGQVSSTYRTTDTLLELLTTSCNVVLASLFPVVGSQPVQNWGSSQVLTTLQQCQQTLAVQSQVARMQKVTRVASELTTDEQLSLFKQEVCYSTNSAGQSTVTYSQPMPSDTTALTQGRTDLDTLVAFLQEGQHANEFLTVLPS